jgi:uncharacterized membrane protein YraQ (UPF0718 family)
MTKTRREIAANARESVPKTLFLVCAGLIFAITLGAFVRDDLGTWLEARVGTLGLIVGAELVGFVSPGPRYILYPVLVKLVEAGVTAGAIIALIGGHVLIEPSTTLIEGGLFGWRFPVKRFLVSFFITFLAGMLTVFLETYCGLGIL